MKSDFSLFSDAIQTADFRLVDLAKPLIFSPDLYNRNNREKISEDYFICEKKEFFSSSSETKRTSTKTGIFLSLD